MKSPLHSFEEMKWSKNFRETKKYAKLLNDPSLFENKQIIFQLQNSINDDGISSKLLLSRINDNAFHLFIEPKTLYYRVEKPDSIENLQTFSISNFYSFSQEGFHFTITSDPFSISIHHESSPNSVKLSHFSPNLNSWEVTFNGNDCNLLGIPERSGPLFLLPTISLSELNSNSNMNSEKKITILNEPYRLFNCDTGEFRPSPSYSVYGAIPFLSSSHSAIYLANASDTFVDLIQYENNQKIKAHFQSEYPPIDLFLFFGPRSQTTIQFKHLVGHTFIPTLSDFGFQHCKWGLSTQKEAEDVIQTYEKANIPFDVLWLDIDHLYENRPFTWNFQKFPSPKNLFDLLHSHQRRLARILDPHLSLRSLIHDINKENNCENSEICESKANLEECPKFTEELCMKKNGKAFIGHCWPGPSVWPDFLDENVRKWWIEQIKKSPIKYEIIWNDMNEPSVFNSEEITFPRDTLHLSGIPHFCCHNIYGHWMSYASRLATNSLVLTRSFFAGTQKHAAIWTGDCPTTWESLKQSISTILTLSLCGISYVGADIGGFFDNPSDQLFERWFEIGVWIYPFLRCHGHFQTQPRHHRVANSQKIKNAILERYKVIPYWHVSFIQDSQTGIPVIRPLFFDYPNPIPSLNGQKMENDWNSLILIGDSILVHLSGEEEGNIKNETKVNIKEITGNKNWFDFRNGKCTDISELQIPKKAVNVFVKEGSIIPMCHEIKGSALESLEFGYDLFITLDGDGNASGYITDLDNSSKLLTIRWENNKLEFQNLDKIHMITICSIDHDPIFQTIN